MAKKRSVSPPRELPPIFAVRADDKLEANKDEREAWALFLRWCSRVPEGTRVELLRHAKVIAFLQSAGTRPSRVVLSGHDAPAAAVA